MCVREVAYLNEQESSVIFCIFMLMCVDEASEYRYVRYSTSTNKQGILTDTFEASSYASCTIDTRLL